MILSALVVPIRSARLAKVTSPRPTGAKLQIIERLDPEWVKVHLDKVLDWKLAELGVKRAS